MFFVCEGQAILIIEFNTWKSVSNDSKRPNIGI